MGIKNIKAKHITCDVDGCTESIAVESNEAAHKVGWAFLQDAKFAAWLCTKHTPGLKYADGAKRPGF